MPRSPPVASIAVAVECRSVWKLASGRPIASNPLRAHDWIVMRATSRGQRLAVAEARSKDAAAFKEVLDRMEARELHLTEHNTALLRQAETREASYERALASERNAAAGATEDAREARFNLEKAGLREKALQDAAFSQDKAHAAELNTARRDKEKLRLQLEDYARRYGSIGGKFTATDVLRDE